MGSFELVKDVQIDFDGFADNKDVEKNVKKIRNPKYRKRVFTKAKKKTSAFGKFTKTNKNSKTIGRMY